MAINRRDFISTAASAFAFSGCASAAKAVKNPEPKFIWSYLAHFGVNSWRDVPLETQDPSMPEKWLTRCCANHVRFDEPSWQRISAALAKAGCNQIVIDLAEIVEYPSHPELAVKGSWSVEKLRKELARLRGMGFEVIPKLNFSACHDTWLKDYHRMVSTKKYYQVCEDVIKDVAEMFDYPRYFHLGYDEETPGHQSRHLFAVCRQGDLWWHDMIYTAKEAERHGARGWIWSDKEWKSKDEFMAKCPRSIVQSHWYYSNGFGPEWEKRNDKKMNAARWAEPYTLCAFKELDEGGFDQIACGSNIYSNTNFPNVVEHCLKNVSKERLLGFLNAPWGSVVRNNDPKKGGSARYLAAVDQLAAARKRVAAASIR